MKLSVLTENLAPASYVLSATVLVTVAVAASLVAGRRAAHIDPTQALRYE